MLSAMRTLSGDVRDDLSHFPVMLNLNQDITSIDVHTVQIFTFYCSVDFV